MKNGKVVIFSAPSGSGKTTIIHEVLKHFDGFEFSISACSRTKRPNERDGIDYYFMSPKEFRNKADKGEFVEWEEVYENQYYGTLKWEMERIWNNGHEVLFDVDVKGGVKLKEIFNKN